MPRHANPVQPRAPTERPSAIRVSNRFQLPPQRVFDAWLDPEIAGSWLFATASRPMTRVEINARVTGSFRFEDRHEREIIEHTGEYVEIVPHRRLVFTLSVEKHPQVITRVAVEIAPLMTGCELTLIQENVPPSCAERTEARWTGILYGLGETLESPGT